MKRGDVTRERMLAAALVLAQSGLHRVTTRAIGAVIGCAHTNVRYYFGTAAELRQAVAEYAIANGDKRVIARLIMDEHSSVAKLSRADRKRYLDQFL